ncbi:hypothetical protein, partial [Flavobacterium sp.]|uniref:hypothetical protein n=1 Tax=Flavobacterium sp. TaxID=239 RepID=UPI0025C37AF5
MFSELLSVFTEPISLSKSLLNKLRLFWCFFFGGCATVGFEFLSSPARRAVLLSGNKRTKNALRLHRFGDLTALQIP